MKYRSIGQDGQFSIRIKGEVIQLMELEGFARKMKLSRYKAKSSLKEDGALVVIRRGKRLFHFAIVSTETKADALEVKKALTGKFEVLVDDKEWLSAMFTHTYTKQEGVTKEAIKRRAESPRFNVEVGRMSRYENDYRPLVLVLRRKPIKYASTSS